MRVLKVTGIDPSAVSKRFRCPAIKLAFNLKQFTIPTLSTDKVQKLIKLEGVQFWIPPPPIVLRCVKHKPLFVDQMGTKSFCVLAVTLNLPKAWYQR
jgi:hypothetical protein